ncbi:glycosyltransferase [Yinghuangia seranimata]|uniref:glycosyltransferase n=1 Tax=Yinghuangia seranimata TaxID=408067 RepID=UPI00248B99C1|nr:nucleotide disphospho-sugar-binding domain-containing protein [Yinghuangia seranimata]MDI2127240.1 glycosyltransferase [Yinghuangia seranimata]
MKCLFVVPPFAGHVNPTVAVAAELAARGHTVAWCGPPEVRELLPPDAELHACATTPDGGFGALHARWRNLRGVQALRFLVEDVLVPLAATMRPGVDAALAAARPDVVVADQQAFAGALGATLAGLPWATSATTSAEFTRPFEGFPKVHQWVRDRVRALGVEAGLGAGWDPRFSPHLVLIFSTPELAGGADEAPPHHRYVGPAFGARPAPVDFPWERLAADRRRVLVSLGTLNREAGTRFYPAVAEATRALADRVQVVMAVPDTLLSDVPGGCEHVITREFVPQLDLLPHLDAVVTHGGHNTVCEALAFGLPLVVAPIRDDQPLVAQQVVAAGAGVRVRFGRAHVPEIRQAITDVLERPEFREGARRVRDSFAAAGGASSAADALEHLAATP